MSRKSDIELVSGFRTIREIAEAAYDLGRAAQAEKDCRRMDTHECWLTECLAKRLRAKVRRATGETR